MEKSAFPSRGEESKMAAMSSSSSRSSTSKVFSFPSKLGVDSLFTFTALRLSINIVLLSRIYLVDIGLP